MEIMHDESRNQFRMEAEGLVAHVAYEITDGGLDIRHTIVPKLLEGRGIASALVKAAYDYAKEYGLKPVATCAYAVAWLQRHPEYNGEIGKDYCEGGSCAL